MTMTTKWAKVSRGVYERWHNGVRFQIQYSDEQRLWRCVRMEEGRRPDTFDAADTLREAKLYCHNGE